MPGLLVEVGAGDGRAAVALARREPSSLVVALDAAADGLIAGERRARKARLDNVVFVVSGIEQLPRELEGAADEVRVWFPWGSLLRGILGADDTVVGALARLCRAGASVRVLTSVMPGDHIDGCTELTPDRLRSMASTYHHHGLALERCGWADAAEIAASGSSWAKRLGAGRPVVSARFRA